VKTKPHNRKRRKPGKADFDLCETQSIIPLCQYPHDGKCMQKEYTNSWNTWLIKIKNISKKLKEINFLTS